MSRIMKKNFFNKNNPWKLCSINEENKSKEIQCNSVLPFTKFVSGGFCPGGFWLGGFLFRRLLSGFMSEGFLSCHRNQDWVCNERVYSRHVIF